MTLKGNIMILLVTPMPASTASEIEPAMLLSTMPATTARPERNMEEEPILTIWVRISRLGWKNFTDSRSRLRLVR